MLAEWSHVIPPAVATVRQPRCLHCCGRRVDTDGDVCPVCRERGHEGTHEGCLACYAERLLRERGPITFTGP